ncbi:hypothetical protein [Clostridium perfringens]|uniref:hypothetical protein n=1 Tax=Clostridium perfringens TaxID=1502 RepID=UPI0022468C77|nr:hypothetical protein [Clostridium perfringens]MCX0367871.1 hypothetical protein [Clostridium perfringens]
MNNNEITTEILHKEIDLIQSCISRMAKNSFLIKGWFISLVAVILALLPKKIDMWLVLSIVLVITLSFWYLDAFFLRTEKLYRKLYDWTISERAKNNKENLYDLNPHRFDEKVDSISRTMFSPTLRYFYLFPVILTLILVNLPNIINFLLTLCKKI